jgi:DNA gyrase subunit A
MAEQIIENPVTDELSRSFLEYSMSVIVARALPDVRDGLKPVHRRILFALHEMGIRPSSPYKKCARVTGEAMGKYHPHGDSAIYEALVRMAQEWSLRVPVVDGHGNFGSLDDGPAAARYTECRMSAAGAALLEDLREDTVDFEPNYDGTEQEPVVLPSAFPNLLVNGSQGIAVGMATNMAPHNLAEVVAALKAMLADPSINLDGLMAHLPGPDLPTGALIYQLDGVREAYETGRGSFKMRARARVIDVTARKKGIEITELPYQVGPEKVIARVKELLGQKKLQGIADIKDYSDRKVGLRLVVECKTGFNPEAVLAELYRLTPLEDSFGINAVCLVDGQPRTLGLVDLCRFYLEHRREVLTRRTRFRLVKAEARAHIIEGLLIALASIDEIVSVIKASKDTETARTKLMKSFALSEIQASHILEMPLRRLTSLEVTKLKDEMKEIKATIAMLKKLLASAKEMTALIAAELDSVVETFATPRRTTLLADFSPDTSTAPELEVPDEPCVVALSATGHLSRFVPEASKAKPTAFEAQASIVASSARAKVLAVTSTGRVHAINVSELPVVTKKTRGALASEYVALEPSERVVALLAANLTSPIALATRQGVVKRLAADQMPTRTPSLIITLSPDDEVVGAALCPDDADLVLVTSDAQLLKTPGSKIRPQGRSAGGVAGIRLNEGAHVLCFDVPLDADVVLVTVTDKGTVKYTALSEYPDKGRGTGGVRCMRLLASETAVIDARAGVLAELLVLDAKGAPIDVDIPSGRRDASGVKLTTPVAGLAQRSPRA